MSCQSGLSNCAGVCVDTLTSNAHCGGCANACSPGELCSAEACSLSCQTGLTDCSGVCTDLDKDRDHCGSCGNACGATEICDGTGMCDPVECPPAAPFIPVWGLVLVGFGVGAVSFHELRRRRHATRAMVVLLAVVIGTGVAVYAAMPGTPNCVDARTATLLGPPLAPVEGAAPLNGRPTGVDGAPRAFCESKEGKPRPGAPFDLSRALLSQSWWTDWLTRARRARCEP